MAVTPFTNRGGRDTQGIIERFNAKRRPQVGTPSGNKLSLSNKTIYDNELINILTAHHEAGFKFDFTSETFSPNTSPYQSLQRQMKQQRSSVQQKLSSKRGHNALLESFTKEKGYTTSKNMQTKKYTRPKKKASDKAKDKLQALGVKEGGKSISKSSLAELTSFQKGAITGTKALMGGTALFIGATSIIDASVTANRNKKARKEVDRRNKKEEENMKRDKKYRKKQRRRDSRNSIHVGQTVMDMFDQRIGHHKMGGSKNFPA